MTIVDLSYHKGEMDVPAIAASGVVANIHKATDGFFMPTDYYGNYSYPNHVDISFLQFWRQFREYFKWRGAYHFLRVDDEVAKVRSRPTSLEQIDLFYDVVTSKGLYPEDYIVVDIEQVFSEIDYLSARQIGDRVKAAVYKTEQLFKRKPILYTGAWWWEHYHHEFDKQFFWEYPFWISHYWPIENNELYFTGSVYYLKYNRVFPREWRDNINDRIAYARVPAIGEFPTINPDMVWLWQYSSSGRVPGTNNTSIDLNIEVIPEREWVAARGEGAVEPPDPPEPPEEPIVIPSDGIFTSPNPFTVQAVGSLKVHALSDNWSAEKLEYMIDAAQKLT